MSDSAYLTKFWLMPKKNELTGHLIPARLVAKKDELTGHLIPGLSRKVLLLGWLLLWPPHL